MKKNTNLHKAKNAKKDEFYTQLIDIENELKNYQHHFKDKVVYCNCDDPRISNFFHYFSYSFKHWELNKLITTCYKNQDIDFFSQNKSEQAIYLEYNGEMKDNIKMPDPEKIGIKHLKGDGDFRSKECIDLLKQADIVITNPPFSLFREYVTQLIEYDKKFLIIGNVNAVTYKEIFKFIKENRIWLGVNSVQKFEVPDSFGKYSTIENSKKYFKMGNVGWFTNLDYEKRNEELILYKTYKGNEKDYPKYDNYDAINVDKTKEIPMDYKGAMGVPITFLDKFNPEQFEIIKFRKGDDNKDLSINGKHPYFRILIKNKRL